MSALPDQQMNKLVKSLDKKTLLIKLNLKILFFQ